MRPPLSRPDRPRYPLLPLLALTFSFLTLTQAVPHRASLPEPCTIRWPSQEVSLIRNVDDVGPAFVNATEVALEKAKKILSHYSTAVRVVAIPTGLAVTFFGYFLLGPVLFLAGFVSGGAASFIAVNAALGDTTPVAAWVSIAAMLLGGAMLGFLALRALSFGMFAVGAALGVVLASAVKASLIAKAYPKDPELAFIITATVCGLIFGLLAICLQKQMLILSTAYAGSCAAVFGIGHFAGHFPTTEELAAVETGKLEGWVLFYIFLALGLGTAGMFFQFWLGRGKEMPTHAPQDRRRRRRRVRHYEPDDWSDDRNWEEEVFVERIPVSSRKYERVDRSDPQSPLRRQHDYFKAERQSAGQPYYTRRSWNNDRSATSAFDEDSSAQESDVTTQQDFFRGGAGPEQPLTPNHQSAAPGLDPMRAGDQDHAQSPPAHFVPSENELIPEPHKGTTEEYESTGEHGIECGPAKNTLLGDAPDGVAIPKAVAPLEMDEGGCSYGEDTLVDVPLESDAEYALATQ